MNMLLEEKINILLVDDHPENLLALGAILETPRYNLVKALSGEEALKSLLFHDFAVILMDVQMPGMDGFEAAAIIRNRKRTRHTPIIFLTAIDKSENRVATAYELGAVDYLFKPVVPEILQSKVSVFVELFSKTEEIRRQAAQLAVVNQQLAEENIQRKQIELALREAHDELEIRVRERTAELTKANEELRTEITSRQRAESERMASEERFRATFNQAAVGIAHVGIDGKWLLVNQKLCDIVGYTLQELQSLTFQTITHPEDLDTDLEYIRQILANEIQTYSMEKRYIRKDADQVWVQLTVSLVRDALGEPMHFISVVEDIFERKQAESALRQSEQRYRLSLQEKEVLLKEIHHRVKNNLQIISSLLNLQSEYIQDKQYLESFKVSQNRIETMALIHEKLYQSKDLARIEFAEYIQDLVDSLLCSYHIDSSVVTLKLKLARVFLDIAPAIPCALIINELVLNCFNHAFPAGNYGEISIEFYLNNDNKYTLIISDNGIGFPPDFDFRNTSSLGLQLVNALTKQLEGTIELNTSGGAEFKITFPGGQ